MVKVSASKGFRRTALAQLVHAPGDGSEPPFFMFEKRKFTCDPKTRSVSKVKPPTRLPVGEYIGSSGLSAEDVDQRTKLYGPNRFEIPAPQFLELYYKQLLSLFVVQELIRCAVGGHAGPEEPWVRAELLKFFKCNVCGGSRNVSICPQTHHVPPNLKSEARGNFRSPWS